MVPHSWIIECLDLFGVADNIESLLVNSMEKWKLMLCSENSELGEVEIERGIFEGDFLSPLVFVSALIPLIGCLCSTDPYSFMKEHVISIEEVSC